MLTKHMKQNNRSRKKNTISESYAEHKGRKEQWENRKTNFGSRYIQIERLWSVSTNKDYWPNHELKVLLILLVLGIGFFALLKNSEQVVQNQFLQV